MRRMATNIAIPLDNIQSTEEIANSTSVLMSGIFRPYLSLSGPMMSCPSASPIMLVVRPSCTSEVVASNVVVMDGRAGRYISVTNGANAVSAASMTKRNIVGRSVVFSIYHNHCVRTHGPMENEPTGIKKAQIQGSAWIYALSHSALPPIVKFSAKCKKNVGECGCLDDYSYLFSLGQKPVGLSYLPSCVCRGSRLRLHSWNA